MLEHRLDIHPLLHRNLVVGVGVHLYTLFVKIHRYTPFLLKWANQGRVPAAAKVTYRLCFCVLD
jgi:hypothetical protein